MSDKQTVVALHTEPLLQTINTPRPPTAEPRLRRRAPWSKLALHPVSLSHILHAASLCFDEADRRPRTHHLLHTMTPQINCQGLLCSRLTY